MIAAFTDLGAPVICGPAFISLLKSETNIRKSVTGPAMGTLRARGFAVLVSSSLTSACLDRNHDRPPAWPYVSAAITEPNCASAGCHNRETAAAELDFSTPERGYASMSRSLVVPFDPVQSRLVQLLRGIASPAVPPDRSLSGADLTLIENWIRLDATNGITGVPPGAP